MLNRDFATVAEPTPDLYPEALRPQIDELNERVYRTINNGVYRCGFARTQLAYDEAFDAMFDTLEMLEGRLGTRRYLVGDTHTLADWHLFPTLVRFDTAYYGAFKCNKRRIQDSPNLWHYLRDLYAIPVSPAPSTSTSTAAATTPRARTETPTASSRWRRGSRCSRRRRVVREHAQTLFERSGQ